MMQPIDFVKEMIGIAKMIPEGTAPTLEQWNKIVDSLGEAMGYVVKKRMDEMEQEDRYRVQQQGYSVDKLYGFAQGVGIAPIYTGGIVTGGGTTTSSGIIGPLSSMPTITFGPPPQMQNQ